MSLSVIDLAVPIHCLDVALGLSSHPSGTSTASSDGAAQASADLIVVGGGGGPGSTGLINKLCCLDWDDSGTNLIHRSDISFGKDEDAPWSIAIMSDGSLIAAGVNAPQSDNANRNCRILSRSNQGLKQIKAFNTTSTSLGTSDFQCAAAFAPDGHWLATGSDAGTLSVFDTSGFTQIDWTPLSIGSKIFNLTFTTDSSKLIVTSERALRVYKVDSGDLLLEIKPPTGHTFRAGRLGLGCLFYTVVNFKREKCILSIWNLDRPDKPIKSKTIANKSAVSFIIRDEVAAIGLIDCSFVVLRSLSRVAIHRKAHDVPITSLGIVKSPRGILNVVSASGDGLIKVWAIPAPNMFNVLVPSIARTPLAAALFALVLAIWVTWLILGALVPAEQLIQLGIPFISVEGGHISLVAMHVPWLKNLGIARAFG